ENGIPYPCNRVDDLLSVIIQLDPTDKGIFLRLLKDYDNKLEGTPLLFIHGWLGSSIEWSYQIFHFSLKSHIILIDLPGFGKSDKPNTDYSIEFFTKQIVDFIHHLGYVEVYLIGHSLGGLIAQNIALTNANLVKKLILINSATALSPSINEKFIIFWINILFKLFYRNFLKKMIKQIISAPNENREFKKLFKNALKLPKALVLSSFKNMTTKFTLQKELSRICQTTLIIYGTDDKIVSKSMVETLNNLIPLSKLKIIKNGSHRVMYDNYGKVNDAIEEFINK
ncbi:MAG: alpha/beta fold hydrolase, partial [Candidatus Odinarchaeota archaeon]